MGWPSATGSSISASVRTIWQWFDRYGRSTTITALNSPGTQAGTPREGSFPTIGSWISYGLGTMNQNLPEYVVLGQPTGDCCGGEWTHGAGYLGPEHAGVRLDVGSSTPLPFVSPAGGGLLPEERAATFSLVGQLNQLSGVDYPEDAQLRARIKSYELAFGMQTAVPETLDFKTEHESTSNLYGLDHDTTRPLRPALSCRAPACRTRSAVCPSVFMAEEGEEPGTLIPASLRTIPSCPRKWTNRLPAC